ncbi:MAG: hypothetical protein ACOYK6_07540 [Chthoniobacterales bacterium]
MNILWIRWLSLFSLDAVLVALSWQEVLARASHVHPTWQERALLGISVWIIYIVDHLLDATSRTKLKNTNQAPRHYFVLKHRFFFVSAIVLVLLIDIALLPQISSSLLVAGSVLGLITVLYLFFNTSLLTGGIWPRGKEILISLIFTLGCGLVPFVHTHEYTILLFAMMGFLILNTINCILIARLERVVDRTDLSRYLIPSPSWIVPSGLTLLLLNHLAGNAPMVTAFFISLMGLSLVPGIAKHYGYEVASLATDGALVLGAVVSFWK